MSLEVQKAGLLTTVQDLGRHGYQKQGVAVGGAMDAFALRVANLLVGNAEGVAGLEVTLAGPRLVFQQDVLVAVCGGEFAPKVDGVDIPSWQPVWVQAGCVLELQRAVAGCRAYLAVAGGVDVPEVMGSRSTFLRAGLGGTAGRALREGDVLAVGEVSLQQKARMAKLRARADGAAFAAEPIFPSPGLLPAYAEHPVVRVLRGREYEWFDAASRERLWQAEFAVSPQSDRMGYRLQGEALTLSQAHEMISEAVTMGTVQVPADGQPIVLMADRQTTGGYPRIAQVITVDLPVLAQVKPGAKVRFQEVTLEEAHGALLRRERELVQFRTAVELRDSNSS
ncbi:antagonist of KipI [Tumebacillus sp. BK434]|uniref:5-oxoprolinase subunit C family protein n=1 Tax=Tumebacillus sp. BK434 TaxID=2512169 RepID=UPI001048DFD3|nr:biotin-dependent carboxyltransferase family protein [Tumebacillus sp. BK434]TCP57601.1 antagonist of KipI [Tumebacillus sp. BK434]